MDDKKKYLIPEAEIVDFAKDEIITISGEGTQDGDWTKDDNGETFGL